MAHCNEHHHEHKEHRHHQCECSKRDHHEHQGHECCKHEHHEHHDQECCKHEHHEHQGHECCKHEHHGHQVHACCKHDHHEHQGHECCKHEHHKHHGCGCGHDHEFEIGCGCGHDHGHTGSVKEVILRLAVTVAMVLCALLLPVPGWGRLALYLVAYGVIGYDILRRSLHNIRHGQVFDESFLMSVASLGALCLGEFTEGVAVLALYQLGEMLQGLAVDRSRRSISELMDIRPDHANVEVQGQLVRVHPEEVSAGQMIVVRAGERIPLDGEVIEGESTLNTAALTGESAPRSVTKGDQALSGCVNLTGELRIRVTKAYADSTVSRILELVEHAAANKARPEQFITRFARVYTPLVVALAAALALLPPLFTGFDFALWIERALTFLVISCPCALVISVPLTFFSGIGGASRKGILIKGAAYMEKLARTGVMVFDKTGTLTEGAFTVIAAKPVEGTEEELLALAGAVEQHSNHPIALSVCAANGTQALLSAADVREVAGCGLQATVQHAQIAVGNEKMMRHAGVKTALPRYTETAVHVARDGRYLGAVLVADKVKEQAAAALAGLKTMGVHKLVMLTGDRAEVADAVAKKLNVDEVHADLLPVDKVLHVENLLNGQHKGQALVFVGDGINDAPVLARADVGIAMGALGSDAAIEAADVVLMDDDVKKLPLAVRIARGTMRICMQNIVFALGVKGLVLLFGALGLASMWMAVFADVGVCLLAVANAMRAMKIK